MNSRGTNWFAQIEINLDGCSGKYVDRVRKVQGILEGLIENIGVCKTVPDAVRVCKPREAVECAAELSLSVMENYDYKYMVCS